MDMYQKKKVKKKKFCGHPYRMGPIRRRIRKNNKNCQSVRSTVIAI